MVVLDSNQAGLSICCVGYPCKRNNKLVEYYIVLSLHASFGIFHIIQYSSKAQSEAI